MTATTNVSNTQLREWKATNHPYKLIAAAVAEWAASQERGTALPDDEYFRIEASPSTYKRAKKLLQTHGVLEVRDGPFYVALPTPARSFPRRSDGRMVAALPLGCRSGQADPPESRSLVDVSPADPVGRSPLPRRSAAPRLGRPCPAPPSSRRPRPLERPPARKPARIWPRRPVSQKPLRA